MSGNTRARLLVLAVVAICGGVLFGVISYRARAITPAELMKRLPSKDSLVVAIDFASLRKAGVLQMLDGSKMGQEPDYQKFVTDTGFDYTRDLDYALAAFGPAGKNASGVPQQEGPKFLLVKGRFDWKALHAYALKQGGQCYNSLCQMAGSKPERHISFFPLQSNLMALAVAPEDDAALRMENAGDSTNLPMPDGAAWLYLPPAILKAPGELPDGAALFARSVDQAKSVTLSFAPEGNGVAAKLNVLCNSDQDALVTTTELTKVTEVLHSVIAHAGQHPNPGDWSGVLTSGKFENKGSRVFGYWPIDRAFVTNMLGGQ